MELPTALGPGERTDGHNGSGGSLAVVAPDAVDAGV